MASGPDPNRFDLPDPETDVDAYRKDEGLGDLPSTRLGLPAWAVALLALLVAGWVVRLALGG